MELSPKTIAHSLEIIFVCSVAVLSWPWDSRDFRFIDQWLFRVMRKTIPFSLVDRLVKDSSFLVVTGGRYIGFVFEGELFAVTEGSGSLPKSGYFVVVVWCRGDIMGGGEPVGFGEGVELLRPRAVELRLRSFHKCIHLVAIKLINL